MKLINSSEMDGWQIILQFVFGLLVVRFQWFNFKISCAHNFYMNKNPDVSPRNWEGIFWGSTFRLQLGEIHCPLKHDFSPSDVFNLWKLLATGFSLETMLLTRVFFGFVSLNKSEAPGVGNIWRTWWCRSPRCAPHVGEKSLPLFGRSLRHYR